MSTPKRIVYVPLEPYEERYTSQLSAPKVGWFESQWIKHGVNYIRIDGHHWTEPAESVNPRRIRSGSVLDAVGRSRWCANQLLRLYDMIDKGELHPTDRIYFDDFWHPGIESLKYIFQQSNYFRAEGEPKLYSFCWAQSADSYDFTYPMKEWIRHYERGNGELFDKVFVANTLLQELLGQSEIVGQTGKIKVVGLPFNSEQVLSMMLDRPLQNKKRQVVFSSRWAMEKRPELFYHAIISYMSMYPNDEEIKFVFCSSSTKPTVDHHLQIWRELQAMKNVVLHHGLTKQEYYDILCESSVQINTSLQDWVSYTLLEAVCANCQLIYPNERSFPETFSGMADFFGAVPCLNVKNPRQVAARIKHLLDAHLWDMSPDDPGFFSSGVYGTNPKENNQQAWELKRRLIVDTHDQTWKRILCHMGMLPDKLRVNFEPFKVYASQ